jgi:hypothetical protein
MAGKEPQSARAVLMVKPANFAFNPQTAATNSFQRIESPAMAGHQQAAALREFESLADALRRAGIEVIEAHDTPIPIKPDAIFPNNWVSFHQDGTVVLYPMLAPNRRDERREDLIAQVIREGAFRSTRTVDLSYRESQGKFLEGTGSLVLDRASHVAYASLSARTDLDVLGEFAQQLDYELVTFEAFGPNGAALYHTNVLMSVGTDFAVICGEAIAAPLHRSAVLSRLRSTGHEIVDISIEQLQRFAANLLELAPASGRLIVVSQSAFGALHPAERRILESHGAILCADIPTIEQCGGGGVRCMLAEIHLPKRGSAS